ncbi:hypothetical protein B0H14DRAFT_2748707 [Mycena olivaceomarginata]|nr:hypothetical protein B0H14DRAFT_2748707 [Mycena olivaceomarginata]
MPASTHFDNLVQYTSFAAATIKEIADEAQIPFLLSASSLVLEIVHAIQSVKSHKDDWIQVTTRIHEILCAIISLYPSSETDGALPPTLLYDIAKFAGTLQKIYTCLKTQQGMSKLKRLFKHLENVSQLDICKTELQQSLDVFRVHVAKAAISGMALMEKDAKDLHDELLAWLSGHLELTYSGRTSAVTENLPSISNSSASLSMLPPYPQIFHGRETDLQRIIDVIKEESPRVAILGPGGIGKTSLAIAALHHNDVVDKYPQRYFLPCHSATTCAHLVAVISSNVGVDKGPNLGRRLVRHLQYSPSSLLVLDNFETPWEAARADVEEFLSLVTEVPQLGLLITMRGAQRPGKVQWTRPFPAPLQPFSDAAALQTFVDIADENHNQDSLKAVLECTGNLPLAVSLMASVVAHRGCDEALARWKIQHTQLLSAGSDKTSSLDISIRLSFSSSQMNAGAQQLLSILSMLPDGLTDADLIQAKLPIPKILTSKSTLIATSLAYLDNHKRLKVLVPIREHVLAFHPPSAALKVFLRQYFHNILDLWSKFDNLQLGHIVDGISTNLGNLNTILLDSLETDAVDAAQNVESILLLNRFYVATKNASLPLMAALASKMDQWKTQPVYGQYLIELFYSAMDSPIPDAESKIILGNQYFEHVDSIERAKWCHALSYYYRFQNNDLARSLESCKASLKFADNEGRPTTIGNKALHDISLIYANTGNHLGGRIQAERSLEYAKYLGDIHAQAKALAVQAFCWLAFCNFKQIRNLCQTARELLDMVGLKGSSTDLQLMATEAAVHYIKTEYADAHRIYMSVVDGHPAGQLPSHRITLAHINLAAIDVMLGTNPDVVQQNLDIARRHLTTSISYPPGLIYCDMASAELALREGNLLAAKLTFLRCLSALRYTSEEGATQCMNQLADLHHGMHDAGTTLEWSGVFLAFALKNKNKLSTIHALRCLAKIFVAQADDNTALSLFKVALDAFTLMDVHRWRGECMVGMGDIFLRTGDPNKAVELYTAAMSLFHVSSQTKEAHQLQKKLVAANQLILEQSTDLLAQLEGIDTPVNRRIIQDSALKEPTQPELIHKKNSESVRVLIYN